MLDPAGGFYAVIQPKANPLWLPSTLEKRVGQTVRLTAEREAARIPWPRLQKTRDEYVKWEAFVLWVRANEETKGESPRWLSQVVKKRCPGFLKSLTEKK